MVFWRRNSIAKNAIGAGSKRSKRWSSVTKNLRRKSMNPLRELLNHGQSVWLDFISRQLIRSGELNVWWKRTVCAGSPVIRQSSRKQSAAAPITMTPAGNAGAGSQDSGWALYERVAIEDIQAAADVLRPVYDQTSGADGYVSLEVSPHLARDTQATIAEAKRLNSSVNRPNVMIKVPATRPKEFRLSRS